MALTVPNKQHAVEPPLRPNECMLRVTIRLDLSDQTAVAFARAALLRLNVRHAKCLPDVLDKEIMRGDPLSQMYWRMHTSDYMVGSDPRLQRQPPTEPAAPPIALGPPVEAASQVKTTVPAVEVQNFQPPKVVWTRIVEQRMPKPKIVGALDLD